MEQLIVILIFGAIAFFNWAIRNAGKGGSMDKGSPPFTPQQRRPRPVVSHAESEEERMRRFMEALGVPASTPPPPKITRPQVLPPATSVRRIYPVTPPSVVPPLPERTVRRIEPRPIPAVVDYAQAAAAPVVAPLPESVAPGLISPSVSSKPAGLNALQTLLRSPSSIRTAVILREVLGPPKSLQPPAGM